MKYIKPYYEFLEESSAEKKTSILQKAKAKAKEKAKALRKRLTLKKAKEKAKKGAKKAKSFIDKYG